MATISIHCSRSQAEFIIELFKDQKLINFLNQNMLQKAYNNLENIEDLKQIKLFHQPEIEVEKKDTNWACYEITFPKVS